MIRLRSSVALVAFALAVVAQRDVLAQQTFVGATVGVFRYSGDTLWLLRDTTETRVVYHGDTVTRRLSIDGRMRSEMTMVVHGDSAILVRFRDAMGERPTSAAMPAMPASLAFSERNMLASEVRLDQMSRARAQSNMNDPLFVPTSSDTTRTYRVSPATRIVQHGDTLRLLSGCAASRVDTTVFRLFGTDSVRRLSSPARTFAQPMAVSLISQMRLAQTRERLAASAPPLPPGVPTPRDPCAS